MHYNKVLIRHQAISVHLTLLLQLIRNFLDENARSVLILLGKQTTVVQVLDKIEGFYGRFSRSETLLQKIILLDIEKSESFVQCLVGSRIEAVLTQTVKYFHIDNVVKDGMLRSKFWTELEVVFLEMLAGICLIA